MLTDENEGKIMILRGPLLLLFLLHYSLLIHSFGHGLLPIWALADKKRPMSMMIDSLSLVQRINMKKGSSSEGPSSIFGTNFCCWNTPMSPISCCHDPLDRWMMVPNSTRAWPTYAHSTQMVVRPLQISNAKTLMPILCSGWIMNDCSPINPPNNNSE